MMTEKPQGAKKWEQCRDAVQYICLMSDVFKDKDVEYHIGKAIEAMERVMWELENNISHSPKNKNEKAAKFISIFQRKFHIFTEGAVQMPIQGKHRIMIDNAIKVLESGGGDMEEYLNWVYDDYLIRNGKFKSSNPGIEVVVSTHTTGQYFIDMKEKIENRKRIEQENTEARDTIDRYNILVRNEKLPTDIGVPLRDLRHAHFEEGRIPFSEFKDAIIKAEEFMAGLEKQ